MDTSIFASKIKSILLTGIVAGTLDIFCAIVFLAKGNTLATLKFIARGALGDLADEGGIGTALLGLFFHYVIAFSFTIGYYFAYPRLKFLGRYRIVSGLAYGIYVWAFMHFLVLPMTYNTPDPSLVGAWKSILILVFAVGLPISLLIDQHYRTISADGQ